MKNNFSFRRRKKKALKKKIKRFTVNRKQGRLFLIRHIINSRINSRFFMRKAFFLRKLHVLRLKHKTKRKKKIYRLFRKKVLHLFIKFWNLTKLTYRSSPTLKKVWHQVKASFNHNGSNSTLQQRFLLFFLYLYVVKSFFLKQKARTSYIGRMSFKRRARQCIIRRAGAYSVLNKRMKWYNSVKGVLSQQENTLRRTRINYNMPWNIRLWYIIKSRKRFRYKHRSI